nr:hypothetical protein [Halosimplex rubrum]
MFLLVPALFTISGPPEIYSPQLGPSLRGVVGHSRGRLDRDAMPDHEGVRAFTEDVMEHVPEHDYLNDVPVSHVTLLSKTEDTWVPKLRKDSEFWERDPYAAASD